MTCRLRVHDHDVIIGIPVVSLQTGRIIAESFRIGFARFFQPVGDDAADIEPAAVDHFVEPENRPFFVQLEHGIVGKRAGKEIRVAQLKSQVCAVQNVFNCLAIRDPLLSAVFRSLNTARCEQ